MVGVCLQRQINQRSSLYVAAREQKHLLNVLVVRQELKHGRINQEVLCGCQYGFKPQHSTFIQVSIFEKKQKTGDSGKHVDSLKQSDC